MSIWKVCAPVLLSESFGLQVSIEKSDDIFVIYLILQFPEVYKIWFSCHWKKDTSTFNRI